VVRSEPLSPMASIDPGKRVEIIFLFQGSLPYFIGH